PKFGPRPLRELHLESGETVLYFLEEYIDGIPLNSVHKPMPLKEVVCLAFCITEALGVLAEKTLTMSSLTPVLLLTGMEKPSPFRVTWEARPSIFRQIKLDSHKSNWIVAQLFFRWVSPYASVPR